MLEQKWVGLIRAFQCAQFLPLTFYNTGAVLTQKHSETGVTELNQPNLHDLFTSHYYFGLVSFMKLAIVYNNQ